MIGEEFPPPELIISIKFFCCVAFKIISPSRTCATRLSAPDVAPFKPPINPPCSNPFIAVAAMAAVLMLPIVVAVAARARLGEGNTAKACAAANSVATIEPAIAAAF
jgi:hypothetical protein